MKGPRSWNRREFDVTPAGFFSVLKPSGWFSATSRLPTGFRYLIGASKQAAAAYGVETPVAAPVPAPKQTFGQADTRETTIPLQMLTPTTHDHHWMQAALSVLVAVAITCFLLWWIFFRAHPVW
jgi:hypothetical protein